MAKRVGKYGVSVKRRRTLGGTTYMSRLEMLYRQHLDLLSKATGKDKVLSIEEQKAFPIYINGILVFTYKLDFEIRYSNRTEHVDVKGVKTDVYKIKKKSVEAYYGIKIKEVKQGDF